MLTTFVRSSMPMAVTILAACSVHHSRPGTGEGASADAFQSPALKNTSLEYLISYAPDFYHLVAKFDVLFHSKNSSTNGCTAYIHGRYGEPVKSDELSLRGIEEGLSEGEFSKSVKWVRRYYLTGVIDRPDTQEIRDRNERALSIHVEETYVTDYALKE